MKKTMLLTLVCLLGLTMTAGSAGAETVIFSNATNALIDFNGNNVVGGIGTFSFSPAFVTPASPPDFSITSSTLGVSTGDVGWFIAPVGGWVINGPVDLTEGSGKSAVSGTGQVIIKDHANVLFTADLNWSKIETNLAGNAGNLNDLLTLNMTNVAYTGAEADLIALRDFQPDEANLTFIYGAAGHTLTDLTTNGATSSTGYQGTINANPIPIPPSALLLGSALLALVGLRKFSKN